MEPSITHFLLNQEHRAIIPSFQTMEASQHHTHTRQCQIISAAKTPTKASEPMKVRDQRWLNRLITLSYILRIMQLKRCIQPILGEERYVQSLYLIII